MPRRGQGTIAMLNFKQKRFIVLLLQITLLYWSIHTENVGLSVFLSIFIGMNIVHLSNNYHSRDGK